jgi:C1A family cysteine protease
VHKFVHGYIKDHYDHRDKRFEVAKPIPLPASVDLRPGMPSVYDQGDLGSCTANAIGAACEFDLMKNKQSAFMPSRLYIYYNERNLEGTPAEDSGAEIRDGMIVVNAQGVAPESIWPYDVSKFAVEPPAEVYRAATKDFVTGYYRVDQTEPAIKTCLAQGYPVVFGFTVYSAFESDEVEKTGVLDVPAASESVLGGHAVLCVGYTEDGYYLVRNSWGANWGPFHGYFKMAAAYLEDKDLASDLWVVKTIYTQEPQ